MTKIDEKKLKLYTTTIKSIDEENKSIRFQVSDDSVDRYGERVDQKSWDIKSFIKNAVGIWNHRSGKEMEPEDVMANWSDFETNGDKSFATATFDKENPKAMFVFGQYARGFLKAVSVGFIPHTLEFEDDVPVLKDNELLEISFVAIPANANAVALALKDGSLNTKDAQYMMRSMLDGAKQIEEQLKNAPADGEEKHVEELKDQISSLTDLVKGLGENFNTLSTTVDAMNTELTEVKGAVAELKPADDSAPDTKNDNQTPDGEDGKSGASENEDDTAKGGDNDQSGAAEDEFDEDAELTPELQAQIDQEFEAAQADDSAQE